DCVDIGSDINAFKTLYELANRIRKPMFFIPGNHDHSQTDAKSFSEKYYGRYVGPANWYRVIGPFLIASLDTGMTGYADMQQLEWLDKIMAANLNKVKIVLMHHPIFRYNLFASVEGSWRESDKLSSYIYSSWAERTEELQRFLRIVEERGVSLVLSGHVHGDGLVVYNNKTWFVTTTTTGGSADWRGFKIVSIDAQGRVEVIGQAGKNPLSEPSSFTLDGTVFRILYDASREAATVLAKLDPRLGLPIKEIEASLYLNGSIPMHSYSLFGNKTLVKELNSKAYAPWHLTHLTLSVQPATSLVTVASYADNERPSINFALYTPRRPVAQQDRVTLYLRVSDSGWGVWKVLVKYSTGSESGELEAREIGVNSYQVELPVLNATTLRVEAIAWDLAGNVGQTYEEINYIQPEKREETPAAPPEQPPAEEPGQEIPEGKEVQAPIPVEIIITATLVIIALMIGFLLMRRKRS
ncbi:MAG: metallophosphoesterase, partial [Thermofilaceae archaeon]